MKQTLIILGVVLLGIAIVVVYFERKLREQNHKIASMFSLVSSLAEELNTVKYKETLEPETIHIGNQLIDVSDDEMELVEEEEEQEEDLSEDEEESDDDTILQSEATSDDESVIVENKTNIKVLKIELEPEDNENLDYKKMSVGELRSIAIAKGLDVAKLKKGELIELLSK